MKFHFILCDSLTRLRIFGFRELQALFQKSLRIDKNLRRHHESVQYIVKDSWLLTSHRLGYRQPEKDHFFSFHSSLIRNNNSQTPLERSEITLEKLTPLTAHNKNSLKTTLENLKEQDKNNSNCLSSFSEQHHHQKQPQVSKNKAQLKQSCSLIHKELSTRRKRKHPLDTPTIEHSPIKKPHQSVYRPFVFAQPPHFHFPSSRIASSTSTTIHQNGVGLTSSNHPLQRPTKNPLTHSRFEKSLISG